MKTILITMLVLFLAACGAEGQPASASTTPRAGVRSNLMHLLQVIQLPNVSGRIDHLAVDLEHRRLFVAALGNNTVEIVDLKAGRVSRSISGLSEPQGILFLPEQNRLYVANGGNGRCEIYDGSSFAAIGAVDLAGDADNIRYDSNSSAVVVGYGDGGLSFIDAKSGKTVESIELDGHPESFQLESSGSRIFVNVPSANQVAVVDREQQKVVSTWSMRGALSNFPMALDEGRHRLFVGSRLPARLNVLDTETGKIVASLESVADADDIFYDTAHQLIYVIGGGGFIDTFSQGDSDHYQLLARTPTAAGARTGLWVPEWDQLYVAVPSQGNRQAEIQIYGLQR